MDDQVLILADSVTRIDLLRGVVRLAQDGWAPAVAGPRQSELGHASAWADVEEQLELETIFDADDNPGAVWRQIARLLEQAARYAAGDHGVQAVMLIARPAGSRLAAGQFYAALCAGGDVRPLDESYMRMLGSGAIPASRVEILRRGAWTVADMGTLLTGVPADITAGMDDVGVAARYTGAANQSQEGYSVTWAADHGELSPVSLVIATANDTYANLQQVAVIVAQNTGTVQDIDADLMSPGSGGYSTVAGMNARSTNYLRYLPTGATASGTNAATVAVGAAFTAYMICQAVTQPFEVYLECWRDLGGVAVTSVYSGVVSIPAGAPRLVSLGYVSAPGAISRVKLWCRSPNGTTGTPELRIDTLLLVIEGGHPHYAVVADYGGATVTDQTLLTLRHAPIPLSITNPDGPLLHATETATFTYSADPYSLPTPMGDLAVHSMGSAMVVWPIILSTTSFRADVAESKTITVGARRYPAYLVME